VTTDLLESYPASAVFYNAAGVPTNLDATPTLTITLPDGTAAVGLPAVQNGSAGEYFVNYPTVQAGRHEYIFAGLMGGIPVRFGPDVFHVRASTSGPLVSLNQVKQFLGIGSTDVARDELLRDHLEAATTRCETFTGQTWRRRTVVDTFDGGKTGVILRKGPVISVTTVVDSGGILAAGSYTPDTNAGIVYRGSTLGPIPFIRGHQNVVVTYVVGMPIVEPHIISGVLEMCRALWNAQRGGSGGPSQGGNGSDVWVTRNGVSVPQRVAMLLGSEIVPRFA
jgi:hypothetical protein